MGGLWLQAIGMLALLGLTTLTHALDDCDDLARQYQFTEIPIRVTNGQGEEISEFTNNMNIIANITIPSTIQEAKEVQCLLGLGLGNRWMRLMPDACQTVPVGQGFAVCAYTIRRVAATNNNLMDLRVQVKHRDGNIMAAYSNRQLYFKYTGEEDHPETTTKATTKTKTTTTPVPVVDIVGEDDPHDAKMEAYLAAKWAEKRQKMVDDEDKDSEGDWQKLEEEEKKKHELEVQKELEEFEASQAEETRRRDEMIRKEMMDKEENERIENEFKQRSTTPSKQPEESEIIEEDEENVVQVDGNGIVVESGSAGLLSMLVLVVSMVVAVFM